MATQHEVLAKQLVDIILTQHKDVSIDRNTLNTVYNFPMDGSSPSWHAVLSHKKHFRINKKVVRIIIQPQLCPDYCSSSSRCKDDDCGMFHLCKFFILSDSCRYQRCKHNHSLTSVHNMVTRASLLLDDRCIQVEHIRMLFQLPANRTPVTIPVPCDFFNYSKGCCTRKMCFDLHICRHYVFGRCKFKNCKKNHGLEEIKDLLDKYGINTDRDDEDILKELQYLYNENNIALYNKNKQVSSSSGDLTQSPPFNTIQAAISCDHLDRNKKQRSLLQATSTRQQHTPAICLFHLRGHCRRGEKCRWIHSQTVYQWQFRDDEQADWQAMAGTVELERAFCVDLYTTIYYRLKLNDSCKPRKIFINFENFEENDIPIRRLSTVDFTMESNTFNEPWTTKWLWYWQNGDGQWIKYGNPDSGYTALVSSADIEAAYQSDKTGEMEFESEGNHPKFYKIYFSQMIQTNKKYKTQRALMRRPEYVDDAIIQQRKIESNNIRKIAHLDIPSTWSKPITSDIYSHYQMVTLQTSSLEYNNLNAEFISGFKVGCRIKSIKRIENMELWKGFCYEKAALSRKLKREVKEERLYHGTDSNIVDAIAHQGFDCRLAGSKVGHRYGKGGYFGKTSGISSNYCDSGNIMFVVKALVGDFTLGSTAYPRPPLKDPGNPSGHLYDSCVDNMLNPSIFVLFNNKQVYPDYLIKYSFKSARPTALQSIPQPMSASTSVRQTANQTLPPSLSASISALKTALQSIPQPMPASTSVRQTANQTLPPSLSASISALQTTLKVKRRRRPASTSAYQTANHAILLPVPASTSVHQTANHATLLPVSAPIPQKETPTPLPSQTVCSHPLLSVEKKLCLAPSPPLSIPTQSPNNCHQIQPQNDNYSKLSNTSTWIYSKCSLM